MRKLLITTGSVNYNAGSTSTYDDLASLTEGALAVYESGGASDGTVIDGTTPVPAATTDAAVFALGRTNGGADQSIPLFRTGLAYVKETYSAPVAKVMYLGDDGVLGTKDLNSNTTVGSLHRIRFIDLTKPEWDRSREKEVDYTTLTGVTMVVILLLLLMVMVKEHLLN